MNNIYDDDDTVTYEYERVDCTRHKRYILIIDRRDLMNLRNESAMERSIAFN